LGWVEGCFQVCIVGHVEGVFAEYDKSETAQIGALVIGYFFLDFQLAKQPATGHIL